MSVSVSHHHADGREGEENEGVTDNRKTKSEAEKERGKNAKKKEG